MTIDEIRQKESMAREEQVKSRKQLDNFIDAVKPLLDKGREWKSKWFGRPDAELKALTQAGQAISEIADSMGYRLIWNTVEHEIEWARTQLELAENVEIRAYLKALRLVQNVVLATQRDADVASKVLAGRVGAIVDERVTFVKNATVRN